MSGIRPTLRCVGGPADGKAIEWRGEHTYYQYNIELPCEEPEMARFERKVARYVLCRDPEEGYYLVHRPDTATV